MLELLARVPALRGVDGDPDEALELSPAFAHPDDSAVGGEGAPVLAAQGDLALELALVGDLATQTGRGLVPLPGPDQIAQRPTERLLGGVAVGCLGPPVPVHDHPLRFQRLTAAST